MTAATSASAAPGPKRLRACPQAAMPNILVRVLKDSFPGKARSSLVRRIDDAAARAEQIPGDPRKRVLCGVVVDEDVTMMAWRAAGTMSLRPAWSPCRATRQTSPHRSAAQHELPRAAAAWALKTKSASSPSNGSGSCTAFTRHAR
jgi:hypothetical protein